MYGFWRELVKVHPQLFKLSIPLYGFKTVAHEKLVIISSFNSIVWILGGRTTTVLEEVEDLSIPLYGFELPTPTWSSGGSLGPFNSIVWILGGEG